jgi:hypothetical protein
MMLRRSAALSAKMYCTPDSARSELVMSIATTRVVKTVLAVLSRPIPTKSGDAY